MDRDLYANHADMVVNFSRSAAGADALAEANNYQISEDLLNKDIDKLKELGGSLQALVDYHNDKQKEKGKIKFFCFE